MGESPRRVKGAYIQPLQPKLDRFQGKMGVYVRNGHIAFFRKYQRKDSEAEDDPWESTGFVIDLSGVRWQQADTLPRFP